MKMDGTDDSSYDRKVGFEMACMQKCWSNSFSVAQVVADVHLDQEHERCDPHTTECLAPTPNDRACIAF